MNQVLYCQCKPISLLSRLRYIGNCKSGNEQFFKFKELRIFDRIVNHEEFVFISRKDRIASQNTADDRVSFHDVINLVYDEANSAISKAIEDILVTLLVSPGCNFVASVEVMSLMCRNGTLQLYPDKFRECMKKSMFFSTFPLLFNDLDNSKRRKKALYGLLKAMS